MIPLSKSTNPHNLKTTMAYHDSESGGDDIVDHPEDRGRPMETDSEDQEVVETVEFEGAMTGGHGGGGEDRK
ncbi:hypothetical protein RHMOL_Rhmol06G0134400 [Rhododendron molle]|uniref:Uncharacterized protein n=1 Tax=Rhododendron molle TaxID=49168 RepID=A0ACC0NBT6_RHOML|nr:hypothetical protein RHMOL_Rhmol06G0134400 [Rhododendron molle]